MKNDVVIKDTHRVLWYEDGILKQVLGAGRYKIPSGKSLFRDKPKVELVVVDVRERELTIKGQEILTADKVALRVSVIVQFRVIDPQAALHAVANFEERLYGDVQLAARRSLASMTLEEILTNRNRLSEDILSDVKGSAATFGVAIVRADVKDLVFPGNLQEIMNRVLAAERNSQALLVEARTKAEVQRIEGQTRTDTQRREAELNAHAQKLGAEAAAEAKRIQTQAEVTTLRDRAQAAQAYTSHPALLRLEELATLRQLASSGNARLYIDFQKGGQIPPEQS